MSMMRFFPPQGADSRPAKRGYLLIEIILGSAIVAGALGSILVLAGSAREKETFVARDFVATQLVEQGLEISRSEALSTPTTLTGLADGTISNGSMTVATGLQGTYARSRTVASGNDTVGASTTLAYKDVTVTVTYLTKAGTRTTKGFTRIYERSFTDAAGGGT